MRKYLLVFVYFLVWTTLAQGAKDNQHTSKQNEYVTTNNYRITSSKGKTSLTNIYGLENKIGSIKLVPLNRTYKISFNSAEHKFAYNPESGMLNEKNLDKHLAFLCSIIRFLVLEGIDGKEIKIKVTPFKMEIKEKKKQYFTAQISYDNKDDYSKEVNCDIYRVNVSSYLTYTKDFPKPLGTLRDFLERNAIL